MLTVFGRNFGIFGISPIDMVAEHKHVEADVFSAKAAVGAVATRKNGRNEYPVTLFEIFNVFARFGHDSRGFVP